MFITLNLSNPNNVFTLWIYNNFDLCCCQGAPHISECLTVHFSHRLNFNTSNPYRLRCILYIVFLNGISNLSLNGLALFKRRLSALDDIVCNQTAPWNTQTSCYIKYLRPLLRIRLFLNIFKHFYTMQCWFVKLVSSLFCLNLKSIMSACDMNFTRTLITDIA